MCSVTSVTPLCWGEDAAPVTSIALAPAMHPEAELAQLRERLAAMRASVAAMQQEHDAMQQERDDSRAEVARLTTTVAQMTERTAHVRDALNILERKYDSSKVRSRGGGVPQYGGARDRIVENHLPAGRLRFALCCGTFYRQTCPSFGCSRKPATSSLSKKRARRMSATLRLARPLTSPGATLAR